MAIPTRAEAARILVDLESPGWLLEHSATVADIASFLAGKINSRGHAINVPLVEAAALLHDLDKALPADDPHKGLGHADAGAAWLRDHGYNELASSVAGHPVMRLTEDERYQFWVREATVEERVVAYADKRSRQDVVSLDERFERWLARHGDSEAMGIARERAVLLEKDVCAAAGFAPGDVQRNAWAATALAEAR
jgi:putative nucleotidyltransferase with HDIG domain